MSKINTEKSIRLVRSNSFSLKTNVEKVTLKPRLSEPTIQISKSELKNLQKLAIDDEEKERKRFNLIKQIPVVGLVYRAGRAFKFKMQNDDEEVTHSLTVDLANLNPIKVASGITRAALNMSHSYNHGIWIGKRSLKKCKIGLTIKPNADLWHYAIMIHGVVYHVRTGTEYINIETSEDANLKKSFDWNFVTDDIIKTNEELSECIENFTCIKYSLRPSTINEGNCQTFVNYMLSFATGWNNETSKWKLKKHSGTIIL